MEETRNMAVSLVETVRRHAAGLLKLSDLPGCVGLPGEFIDAIPFDARGRLFARTAGAFAGLISRGEVDEDFVTGLFFVARQKDLLTEADFEAALTEDVQAALPYGALLEWVQTGNWMIREGEKEDKLRQALVELVLSVDNEGEIRDGLFGHITLSFLNRVNQSDLATMLIGQRNMKRMSSVDELLWTTFGLEKILRDSDPGAVAEFLMDELPAWDPSGGKNDPENIESGEKYGEI